MTWSNGSAAIQRSADLRKTLLCDVRDRVGYVLQRSSFFPDNPQQSTETVVGLFGSRIFDQRRPAMPFAKIHVLEGRYDEARLDRLSNAIKQTLRTELGMATDELFHIIHLLQPRQFRHTRSFLGLNYSDDLIWLELTLITGRLSKKKRLGLLKALNDGVVNAAQISPDDLLITFFETAGENISFGRGLAQRADN